MRAARVHHAARRRGGGVAAGGARAAAGDAGDRVSQMPYRPRRLRTGCRAFRQGLRETGYVEGDNVAIEYRWAEGQCDRLPALAADLVRRQVAVIAAAGGTAPAFAAKAATATIPIVFCRCDDPVKLGLVASLARPGGNVTGVNFFARELAAKRLELLRELVPGARLRARHAGQSEQCQRTLRDTLERATAARASWTAAPSPAMPSTSEEIDAAFATLVQRAAGRPVHRRSTHSSSAGVHSSHLAARHAVPAIYESRDYADAGGLMSYGTSMPDAYRQPASTAVAFSRATSPPTCRSAADQVRAGHQPQDRQGARPRRAANAARPRRRGDRVSNCHLVAARSLIDLAASRLALRAPALRAATALTRPNRSAQRLPCGRHAVPTGQTVGPHDVVTDHCVERGDHLAHHRHDRDLRQFAGGLEAIVESLERRIPIAWRSSPPCRAPGGRARDRPRCSAFP